MSSLSSDLVTFFQQQIIWILALVGGLVSALKYLDKKQSDKIKDEVKDQIDPYISDICKQLTELKHTFELTKTKYDLIIESIDRAITHFQMIEEGRESKDYRLKDNIDKFG